MSFTWETVAEELAEVASDRPTDTHLQVVLSNLSYFPLIFFPVWNQFRGGYFFSCTLETREIAEKVQTVAGLVAAHFAERVQRIVEVYNRGLSRLIVVG